MSDLPKVLDAKLYKPDGSGGLVPYVPANSFELQTTELGERLVATTNLDRIDFFKTILDLYPGPFFITVVVQEAFGAFKQAGRYYSDRGKTRIQIDFFLDHFHDFISFDGFHHLWISCESSDGIVVYDQHDMFFIYAKAQEAQSLLIEKGFVADGATVDFDHAHRSRPEITPGTEEMVDYGHWWISSLEIQDVARPDKKTLKNIYLRIRTWLMMRRIKQNKRGRVD